MATAEDLTTPPYNYNGGAGETIAGELKMKNASIRPATLADADAPANSIYYSSTASKLVYKDPGGTVRALY